MTGNGSKQLRRYAVRCSKGRWLATVVIADDGYFSTVSQYGNYAYYWGDAGECFRSFLIETGTDYLLMKLGVKNEYDAEATYAAVTKEILRLRRDRHLSADEAAHEWIVLNGNGNLGTGELFQEWLGDTTLKDPRRLYMLHTPLEAQGFANVVWPAFVALLRAELTTKAGKT